MKCLGLFNSWLHSHSVFWTLILCRYNLNNQYCMKMWKCMSRNCTLTLREHYWKADTQELPLQQPTDLCWSAAASSQGHSTPSCLEHCTFWSGKNDVAKVVLFAYFLSPCHSVLTHLSWTCLTLSFEHSSALFLVLCFWVMLPICGLYPAGASQCSYLGVTPQHFSPWSLECGATCLQVATMLLLLICFDAFLPEDKLLWHVLQKIPSIHPFIDLKERQEEGSGLFQSLRRETHFLETLSF